MGATIKAHSKPSKGVGYFKARTEDEEPGEGEEEETHALGNARSQGSSQSIVAPRKPEASWNTYGSGRDSRGAEIMAVSGVPTSNKNQLVLVSSNVSNYTTFYAGLKGSACKLNKDYNYDISGGGAKEPSRGQTREGREHMREEDKEEESLKTM